MAVAIADVQAAAAETVTVTPSGTDRKLYAGIFDDAAASQAVVPACTFAAGAGFTEVGEGDDAAGQYLAVMADSEEPAASGGTLSCTGTDVGMTAIIGLALSGVDRAAGTESVQESEANAASLSVTVTSGSADDLVVGFFSVNTQTGTSWLTASGESPTVQVQNADGGTGWACVTCPGQAADVDIGGSWVSQRATMIAFNVPALAAASAFSGLVAIRQNYRNMGYS